MRAPFDTAADSPLVREVTPLEAWDACQRLADLPYVLFLDSARPGPTSRYSFVTAQPAVTLRSLGTQVFRGGIELPCTDPFRALADELAAFPQQTIAELPPFQGGAAGLLGYDLCRHIEKLPTPRFHDFPIPDMAVGIYDWTLAFDNEHDRAWIISTGYPERNSSQRRARAARRIDQVLRLLERPPRPRLRRFAFSKQLASPSFQVPDLQGIVSNFDRPRYLEAAARAIEYVHAGDCFQVNLAQRLLAPGARSPLDLYETLRIRNPAPFAGFFDLGDFQILSASPERFLQMRDRQIETRPIKGTRPRGKDGDEDIALADELRASLKDRAENVMIVDLLRNDLGRVCEYGSIHVEALCRLESYPFVHHLVSEVRGTLRKNLSAVDLLRAAFPGGSVTGAPKIRSMEIITELERTARGPYCGSLAYLGFDGAMDANLLIRTMQNGHGWLSFSVGGGIVADSTPEKEYDETWHKAEGTLRAVNDLAIAAS